MKKCNQSDMVFTAYITLKNGHRLYAKQVGKKAFCFPSRDAKEKFGSFIHNIGFYATFWYNTRRRYNYAKDRRSAICINVY